MRVIQVIPELRRGGAEKLALQLHAALRERGIVSHLIHCSGEPSGMEGVYSLGCKSPKAPQAIWRLRALIERLKPDIVHAHLTPAQFYCRLLPAGPYSVITTEHNTYNRRRRLVGGRCFDYWLYSRYRAIVCISQATRAALIDWQPALRGRTDVIYNGVRLTDYTVASIKPSRRFRLVAIGRLEEQKNFEVAIAAMNLLRHDPVTLDIFGAGPLEPKLRGAIAAHGVGATVKLRGWSSAIPQVFADYAAIVLCSKWEGFGLVAVEAMASGVIPICARVPGLDEVVTDDSGIGYLPNDSQTLAGAIRRFLNLRDAELTAMRECAVRRSRHFTFERMVDEYARKYEHLVEVSTRGHRSPLGPVSKENSS